MHFHFSYCINIYIYIFITLSSEFIHSYAKFGESLWLLLWILYLVNCSISALYIHFFSFSWGLVLVFIWKLFLCPLVLLNSHCLFLCMRYISYISSQVLQGYPPCGYGYSPVFIEPWLLQAHWQVGLVPKPVGCKARLWLLWAGIAYL